MFQVGRAADLVVLEEVPFRTPPTDGAGSTAQRSVSVSDPEIY